MQFKPKTSDTEYNANWDALLKIFHKIEKERPKDYKEQLEALKNTALKATLTSRQIEGIIDRCNNLINGDYGNTKKPEHYTKQP